MTTTYKVLGQTSATAAATTVIRNLITNPTFDNLLGNTTVQGMSTADNIESLATLEPIGVWNKFANTTNTGVKWTDYVAAAASAISPAPVAPLSGQSIYLWNSSATSYTLGICNGPTYAGTNRIPGGTGTLNSTAGAMPVTAGTTYYYGASAAILGSIARTMSIDIAWYSSSLAYLSWATTFSSSVSSNSWTRFTTSVVAPTNATYAVMHISSSGSSNRGIAIDNVHFSSDSTTNTTFPTPGTTNNATVAPFTARLIDAFSGTTNNSTTINTFAGAPVDLYTTPSATQTIVSTVSVANLGASASNYRIAVVPSGETLAKKHYIIFDAAIPANSTEAITIGMTLSAGDKIKVSSDSADVSFSAFGSELS